MPDRLASPCRGWGGVGSCWDGSLGIGLLSECWPESWLKSTWKGDENDWLALGY